MVHTAPPATHIDARMERVEATQEAFAQDLAAIVSAQRESNTANATAFREINASLQIITNRQNSTGKVNWGAFTGLGGLLLSIGVLAGAPLVSKLNTHDTFILEQLKANQELAKNTGYWERDRAVVYERLDKLDETLQREMRLINDKTESKVADLDRRLQAEMKTFFDMNGARIDKLEAYQQRALEWNATQSAEIGHLEGAKP